MVHWFQTNKIQPLTDGSFLVTAIEPISVTSPEAQGAGETQYRRGTLCAVQRIMHYLKEKNEWRCENNLHLQKTPEFWCSKPEPPHFGTRAALKLLTD